MLDLIKYRATYIKDVLLVGVPRESKTEFGPIFGKMFRFDISEDLPFLGTLTKEEREQTMRVLLVNDDGPPSAISPHVYGLWETLQSQLGWQVSVVLPSSQKSWGSMQFSMTPIGVWYYYPIRGNFDGSMEGTGNSWSPIRRPLKDNEIDEWILLDGSPTTCANVGLHSFDSLISSSTLSSSSEKRPEPFDLVISGPNFGRNTGTAFALGSGTIGAAMAGALSGTKSISLSYGHFQILTEEMKAAEVRHRMQGLKTTSQDDDGLLPEKNEVVELAHNLSCRIISILYKEWEEGVSVYSINIPLSYILKEEKVYWTRAWSSK